MEGYGHVALTSWLLVPVGQQSQGVDSVVIRYRHPTADSRPCGLADLQNQLRWPQLCTLPASFLVDCGTSCIYFLCGWVCQER